MDEAINALSSSDGVQVSDREWLVFHPVAAEPVAGLILCPGGRIDPRAYAPAARDVAAEGYLVAVVPMPLNLAFLGANKAGDVIAAFPEVENWVIGGHSLGGAFAARYVAQHPGESSGLLLWAAYPARNDDLAWYDGIVVSIYGTADGLATQEEIQASVHQLPPGTRWVAIEGGNRGQFGWYGKQPGDLDAAIARAEQQRQIALATAKALADVQGETD
jgi:pimeloyl-ACP methyl ester carboxylesterase